MTCVQSTAKLHENKQKNELFLKLPSIKPTHANYR